VNKLIIKINKNKDMASIDKTYTDSYRQYRIFKDWAETQTITFFDGYKVNVRDFIYDYNKEDFDGRELPIMNTPTWLDIYLIQNCKSKFVLDRMKDVYSEAEYEKFKNINLTSFPPNNFKKNRKILIKKCKRTLFPIHNSPYGMKYWWLQSNDHFDYNDDSKMWVKKDFYYPCNTNTSYPQSTKSLVRSLRKQYLPKNISFTLGGSYVGEEYMVVIK
jgi:hypothetical protein